jgi:hypothetical protein
VGFDFDPEPGLADNGDLEHDLQALLEAAGAAAHTAGTVLAIFELQYVREEELGAFTTALHRAAQGRLPGRIGRSWTAPAARSNGSSEVLRGTPL